MKKIMVSLMVAVSLFFVSDCFAEGLVVVIGAGDTIWARTCQTCAWTRVPGNLKTATVVWDADLEKFVLYGTNAGGQIYSCTFDRGGTFQNDWVLVEGYAQWTTGASTNDKDWKAIHGEYAFTGQSSCLVGSNGINPILTPVDNKVYHTSESTQGVRTFKNNGTGTVQGTSVFIIPPPTVGPPGPSVPSAGSYEFSFQFTYNVKHDGTITTELVPETFLGTYLTGPLHGVTFTIDQLSLSGMVSSDHKTLTLSSEGTAVEQSTNSSGSVSAQICHRSSVLIRLSGR